MRKPKFSATPIVEILREAETWCAGHRPGAEGRGQSGYLLQVAQQLRRGDRGDVKRLRALEAENATLARRRADGQGDCLHGHL